MPCKWERRQGIRRRELVDDVVECRVNERAQFVRAAEGVGKDQSSENSEELAYELWRVRPAAPLQPRAIRFSPKVRRADRDRCELSQSPVNPPLVVGAVNAAPFSVDDVGPLTCVSQRGCRR
jgi:hypothetical protein